MLAVSDELICEIKLLSVVVLSILNSVSPIVNVPSVTSPRLNNPDAVISESPLTLYISLDEVTVLPSLRKPVIA